MMKKVLPAIMICFIFGCASQPRESTYRDYLMDQDLSLERGRMQTPEEVKEECAIIGRDLATWDAKLPEGEGPDSERIREKALGEIAWLKKRAVQLSCEEDFSMYPKTLQGEANVRAEKPSAGAAGSAEMRSEPSTGKNGPQPVRNEQKTTPVPVVKYETSPARPPVLSFDECFQKCKDLTSRTNEQCFDTCLGTR